MWQQNPNDGLNVTTLQETILPLTLARLLPLMVSKNRFILTLTIKRAGQRRNLCSFQTQREAAEYQRDQQA